MQQNKITEILTTPLPKEALKQHPSKRFLTTINPIYVVERLNLAFGIGGWTFGTEVIETNEKFVVVKGTLEVSDHNIKLENYGGNDNPDRGDAYKGASTDALTKCASYLGIGAEVWRNGKPAEKITTPEDEKKVRADFEKRIQGKIVDFSAKNVKSWIKTQKELLSTLRGEMRREVKGAKAKYHNTQGYITQMRHYLKHGDWCSDFYGPYEDKRVKWQTIVPKG